MALPLRVAVLVDDFSVPAWVYGVLEEIERADLVASLLALKRYVRQSNFWYSIIDQREITRSWVESICARLDS